MSQSGIYAIRNTLNGKRYIGSALSFRRRWNLHRSNLRAERHHSPHLQAAWLKHGEGAFVFEVLEVVSEPSNLLSVEQAWLDRTEPALTYNVCRTAGSRLGVRSPQETRERISAAKKGQAASPEARERMRAAALARTPEVAAKIAASRPRLKHKPETKARVSAKLKGLQRSAATRAKIGAASKGRTHSEATKAKRLASWRAAMAAKAATKAS